MRFQLGDYLLDADRRELRLATDLVAVEPQVFDLLVYLVQNRNRVVSKDDFRFLGEVRTFLRPTDSLPSAVRG